MLEPVITTLPDGCVRVTIGTLSGTVSSHHLIQPLVNQLLKKLTPEQQIRSLRTEPHPDKPGGTDVVAMGNRTLVLEALYHLAGRDNPAHTLHGLTTGLWAQPPANLP